MMREIKSPQVEEGYTRIANELLEAIAGFGFTAHQLMVLLALIRKTYGYQKTHDDVSASQLATVCGLARNHVTVALNKLHMMHVITKKPGKFGSILSINKDYSVWNKDGSANQKTFCDPSTGTESVPPANKPALSLVATNDTPASTESVPPCTESVPPLLVQNLDTPSTESVQVASTESVHTKENLPKENQQKKTRALRRSEEICFDDWEAKLKAQGLKLIPEDHSVFAYAEKIKLPIEYVRLCWLEFKHEHSGKSAKKQKDWPATFANYVRKGYYRLWFEKDGGWLLTTRGIQLQKETRGNA